MKDENAILPKDKASLKQQLSNKLKDFFLSHDLDKMAQKYSNDLRTISILAAKVKQSFVESKLLLDICQHQCRKCQIRMLEELNQSRSKTPTKQIQFSNKQEHSHNHSVSNLRAPNRSMTPELNIVGSHIGVVPPLKVKAKPKAHGLSPSKKQSAMPSRSKSPSDSLTMGRKKNITKSPTANMPRGKKANLQSNANKNKLTPSKTDRNVTPKHTRMMTSLSKEKEKVKEDSKKHSRFNTSLSGEKAKKPVGSTITPPIVKGAKVALSPGMKKNIKTPVMGKNKAKEQAKPSGSSTNLSQEKDEDVQHSINEINKTVQGLKASLKITDDSDDEVITKAASRIKKMKKVQDEANGADNSIDNDEDDESIRLEKQMLKREKEKRIMEKLRNEKSKASNREASPDFNTKSKAFAVVSNDLQIASTQQKDTDFNNYAEIQQQKRELHRSANYEISSYQKNEILGSNPLPLKAKKGIDDEKVEDEGELELRKKVEESDKGIKKGSNPVNSSKTGVAEKGNEKVNEGPERKNKSHLQNPETIGRDNKEQGQLYYNENENEQDNDNESKLMKEKREKIREKVMEKRKEKEKSKEKIVKDKNIISNTTNTSTSTSIHTINPTTSPSIINQSQFQSQNKELKDNLKGHLTQGKDQSKKLQALTQSEDNKLLKLLVMTLTSGYINMDKKISIVVSSPQLLPAFQLKHLLIEKISALMKQSSKIKSFLSKYDQHIFTNPFSLSKIASSSISLITKEDELALCKRPQPKEILSLFTALYIILNENHYEVPTKDLVVNMVQVLLKKYQVDSIKSLLLTVIPKKATVTEKQMDLLMEIKEAAPIILVASEITKISKAASYISFVLQEVYDYVFVQYSDGTTLYQVKKAAKESAKLEERIASLQSYL